MGNQIAIKIHTRHGQEIICEERGHVFNYEMAMMAHFSGCGAAPDLRRGRHPAWAQIERKMSRQDLLLRADRTGVAGEHAQHGRGHGVPAGGRRRNLRRAHDAGLPVHLDGARVFNASVALGKPVAEITRKFDSVMFCLSKGLGAPVGSLLVGSKRVHRRRRASIAKRSAEACGRRAFWPPPD